MKVAKGWVTIEVPDLPVPNPEQKKQSEPAIVNSKPANSVPLPKVTRSSQASGTPLPVKLADGTITPAKPLKPAAASRQPGRSEVLEEAS